MKTYHCPACPTIIYGQEHFNEHCCAAHGAQFTVQSANFATEDEFYLWKRKLELEHHSSWKVGERHNFGTILTIHFICDRQPFTTKSQHVSVFFISAILDNMSNMMSRLIRVYIKEEPGTPVLESASPQTIFRKETNDTLSSGIEVVLMSNPSRTQDDWTKILDAALADPSLPTSLFTPQTLLRMLKCEGKGVRGLLDKLGAEISYYRFGFIRQNSCKMVEAVILDDLLVHISGTEADRVLTAAISYCQQRVSESVFREGLRAMFPQRLSSAQKFMK
ncbi:unnamed protein product [Cylicostephanus goldi]|uniref:Uncharacterized protein n=1 Tax=Cylicostephanus goldi TaxID=71465 RepID=A0A3P6RSG4_CYLGO|nr:unnamed protein product [Cylicostephanus goldi]